MPSTVHAPKAPCSQVPGPPNLINDQGYRVSEDDSGIQDSEPEPLTGSAAACAMVAIAARHGESSRLNSRNAKGCDELSGTMSGYACCNEYRSSSDITSDTFARTPMVETIASFAAETGDGSCNRLPLAETKRTRTADCDSTTHA